MKTPRVTISLLFLVFANLAPLVGVFLFELDAAILILLYWTENVVVGLYNILKIIMVRTESPIGQLSKLFTIPFFCLHFAGF